MHDNPNSCDRTCPEHRNPTTAAELWESLVGDDEECIQRVEAYVRQQVEAAKLTWVSEHMRLHPSLVPAVADQCTFCRAIKQQVEAFREQVAEVAQGLRLTKDGISVDRESRAAIAAAIRALE